MKVVILAAGRSKRLKPIPDKNFLEFLGKPLLQHQIEQISRAGFKDFIVVAGAHNLSRIKKLVLKMRIQAKVIEQKNLDDGMAGAVISIEKHVSKEPVLIVSGNDVVDDSAFEKIKSAIKLGGVDGLLLAKKVTSYFPGGYLKITKSGFIQGIVEKPGQGKEPSKLVNLVIHYFADVKKLIGNVKSAKSIRDDRYEKAIEETIKEGNKIKAVLYDGYWQPVKYPWHVLLLMRHFLEGMKEKDCAVSVKKNRKNIAKSAVLKGKVMLGNNVKILDHATVSGPVYIGDETIVASNALVRDSNVGANSVAGYSTEIARSYVGNDVWTHTNYIGDSIINNNCSFGSGTVTGNLRLDEKNIAVNINSEKTDSGLNKLGLITGENIRCGINTSFMPGIKIGSNAMIGAGIIVSEDIEDNKLAYGKTELIIKENKFTIDPKKRAEMKSKLKK